jgi:hypothetical protein
MTTASTRSAIAAAVATIALVSIVPSAQSATLTCPAIGTCTGNISVTEGTPLPNETNIFLTASTGTTFVGNVGANNGPALVTFTSGQQTVSAANGFATFSAVPNNSVFDELTVSVPQGFTFSDLSFGTLGNTDLEILAKDGSTVAGTFSVSNLGSGLNQFLAEASNGSVFTSIMLESSSGFSQIKQIQISGLTQTPLPAGLPLMGSVLGLGYLLRRRRQRSISPTA